MKRTLFALGFSLLALNANGFEYGPPFSQLEIDRALPDIDFPPVEPNVAENGARAPYDQLTVDRALPNLPAQRRQVAETAGAGGTRSDIEISTDQAVDLRSGSGLATGPWANDHHFIAPAQ